MQSPRIVKRQPVHQRRFGFFAGRKALTVNTSPLHRSPQALGRRIASLSVPSVSSQKSLTRRHACAVISWVLPSMLAVISKNYNQLLRYVCKKLALCFMSQNSAKFSRSQRAFQKFIDTERSRTA